VGPEKQKDEEMKKYKPSTKRDRDRVLKDMVKVFGSCDYDYGEMHAFGVAVAILKDLSERLDADSVPCPPRWPRSSTGISTARRQRA
jgi:hypothetical protein